MITVLRCWYRPDIHCLLCLFNSTSQYVLSDFMCMLLILYLIAMLKGLAFCIVWHMSQIDSWLSIKHLLLLLPVSDVPISSTSSIIPTPTPNQPHQVCLLFVLNFYSEITSFNYEVFCITIFSKRILDSFLFIWLYMSVKWLPHPILNV